MSVGIGERDHYNSVLEIRRLHSFISGNTYNGNQTFILDSHRPFIFRKRSKSSSSSSSISNRGQITQGADPHSLPLNEGRQVEII
jgi:hypothetical protein